MKFFSTALLLCIHFFAQAQFTDLTSSYNFELMGTSGQSGCGISFYDYDKDGWDDLTIGQTSNEILVYHNDNGDFNIAFVFPNTGDPKQLSWVDIDNDGDADFFYCIRNNGCRLFRNDGMNIFTEITSSLNLPVTFGNSFGASWGDYDKDGFLDVYVCNYSNGMPQHTNWLLHNNGDGTFTDVTVAMGVGDGFKPSYQSTWVDVNLDGWLDLYVVNDFSFGNQLFINNGTTFDSATDAYGLNIDMEGMSISWSDFDFDTDLDVFISDNLPGNKLLRNDGGAMTNIAASAGVLVNSTCWGSMWMDYDNDGLDDLHISTSNLTVNGNQNYLFHNNGDYTFSDESMVGDNQIVFASAKGDKNNDGYWDFIEMKQYPSAVRLYQNNGGSNHWIKTGLTGTISNKDGIGAIIRYFFNGNEHMCHTFCGEGFLQQDSQYEILSLGEFTSLDSLTITWPSGWIDHHYDLEVDQFYAFVEGETFVASIESNLDTSVCPNGDSIVLTASLGTSYMWSNDSEEESIEVNAAGVYSVVVTNEFGIEASASIEIGEHVLPVISANIIQPSCFGDANGCIQLSATNGEISEVTWNEIAGSSELCSLQAGDYTSEVIDQNGCYQTLSWTVEQPSELQVSFSADTVCFNGTSIAQIDISGGTGNYNVNWNGSDPQALTAGLHFVNVTDENACTAGFSFNVEAFNEIMLSYVADTACENQTIDLLFSISGAGNDYSIDWFGENTSQLSGGDHPYLITAMNGCTLEGNVQVEISPAMSVSFTITNAENGNNGSALAIIEGGLSPYQFLWSNESTEEQLNNIGQGVYPITITDAAGCQISGQAEIIDIRVDEFEMDVLISPNPCSSFLNVKMIQPQPIFIYDGTGKLVIEMFSTSKSVVVNTSNLPSGLYILKSGDTQTHFMKN